MRGLDRFWGLGLAAVDDYPRDAASCSGDTLDRVRSISRRRSTTVIVSTFFFPSAGLMCLRRSVRRRSGVRARILLEGPSS